MLPSIQENWFVAFLCLLRVLLFKAIGKFRTALAFVVIPALALADAGQDGGKNQSIRLSLAAGKPQIIALEARQAPLGQVLDEITKGTGIPVHYSVLPEGLVSATCAGETLKAVLTCLMGSDTNLLFRYPTGASKDGSPAQPAEVWVLGTNFERRPLSIDRGHADRCLSADGGDDPSQHGRTEKSGTGAAQSQSHEKGKLLESASGSDPAQRAQAIATLAANGLADEPLLRKTLEQALSDENAEVRAQAVNGLAQRGGAEAPAFLRAAMQDSDASVRLMAVDSAGNDSQSLVLLQEALADPDETVSTYAAEKLDSLTQEEKQQ